MFRHRTSLPLPIAAAILFIPPPETRRQLGTILTGVALTAIGEAIRIWGVHHIGAISRTRSDRLGPLVDSGPFAYVRNPLYLGNMLLWVGFAVAARLVWLAPIVVALLAVQYRWIVRWEERLLVDRLGEPYREYARRVPRWIPRIQSLAREPGLPARPTSQTGGPDWRARLASQTSLADALFSERGTLIAIAAGYALLWLKARF